MALDPAQHSRIALLDTWHFVLTRPTNRHRNNVVKVRYAIIGPESHLGCEPLSAAWEV